MKRQFWLELAIVVLLFAAALAVRTYRLDEIPPGLFNDEAANGLDVREIQAGNYAVFYPRNSGREPFFLYVQALVTGVVGDTPFGLRFSAALIGALTVPATYGMVRALFAGLAPYGRAWALYSAALMAFSYWHISLSRLGFRAISLPLFIALTLLFLGRAWSHSEESDRIPYLEVVLAGVFLGGSQYTYTAARFFPLAVGAALGAAVVLRWAQRRPVARVLAMSGVLVGAAVITYLPLGSYFLQHPENFFGRAQAISIFSPAYGDDNPALALWRSALDTVLMYWNAADPNLRHNPAQRPVFEMVMSAWLLAGLAVAVWRWRSFPYLVTVSVTLFLMLPAMLTAEGTPHSLRSVGMMPAVFVLAALGMLAAGQRLFARRAGLVNLFPLPFVLFSAVVGVNGYFSAWDDPGRFRLAFLPDYVRMGQEMSQVGDESVVWLLPVSPAYFPEDFRFHTVEYFYSGDAGYAEVRTDPETAPDQLQRAAIGRAQAFVPRTSAMQKYKQAEYLIGDPKRLLPYLLRKYGRVVTSYGTEEFGVPFTVYDLPADADYAVMNEWLPRDTVFDGTVELVGADYGGIPVADPAFVGSDARASVSGEPIWAALQWRALTPIDVDLKVGVTVRDAAGNVVGEVDDLLVADTYPAERTWAQDDVTLSYHIVPTLAAIPPGEYEITARVYEEDTGRVYPVRDETGAILAIDAPVGTITIDKALSATVAPQHTVDDGAFGPDLVLLGYDMAGESVRPGDTLDLTLYWQAQQQPSTDYGIDLALQSPSGERVPLRSTQPAGGAYPTSQWVAGETVRDMHSLTIPAVTQPGTYTITLTVADESGDVATRAVQDVTVGGLAREFDRPSADLSASVDFGGLVELVGVGDAPPSVVEAGDTVTFDLLWAVTGSPPGPLVRFVHLLDANGQIVAQQDTVPCDTMCPASGWIPGEFLTDGVTVALPHDLLDDQAGGVYQFTVGLYEPDGFARLPYVDEHGKTGDAFPLLEIEVRSQTDAD